MNKNGFVPLQELQQQFKKKKQQQEVIERQKVQKVKFDKKIYSKYQITPQTFFYIKFGLYWLNDSQEYDQPDRLVIKQYDKLNPNIQSHWMKFRIWTYEQSCKWKSLSTQIDVYKNYVFNKNKLFRTKIRNLLIDWSFKQDNPDMRLMHVNGVLADQSLNLFMNLHPNILFHVQNKLRQVLQYNG